MEYVHFVDDPITWQVSGSRLKLFSALLSRGISVSQTYLVDTLFFRKCNGCGMPTEDAYSSGHLVLSHFGTCKCSNVETNISWTCLVSRLWSFEHPSVLLFLLHARPWPFSDMLIRIGTFTDKDGPGRTCSAGLMDNTTDSNLWPFFHKAKASTWHHVALYRGNIWHHLTIYGMPCA